MGKRSRQTQTRTIQLPSWYESGGKQAISSAQTIANRAYTPYEGQRVASLSPNEQSGISMAGHGSTYRPYLEEANRALGGMQDWTQADRDAYMNPYMEAVLSPALRRRQRNYESERSALRATAGMRGAFGGRQDVRENALLQQHEEGLDDLYGTAYGAAYDQALKAFDLDQQRKVAQAGAYRNLAGTEMEGQASTIRNLMETGLVGRTQDQMEKDFQYAQFLEERDWDVTNLQPLLDALGTVRTGQTETITSGKSGGGLQQLVGLAATVVGAVYGGPAGAAAGSQIGSSLGGAMDTGAGDGMAFSDWDAMDSGTWNWGSSIGSAAGAG